MTRMTLRRLPVLLALGLIVGCTSVVATHGHMVDPDALASIKVGQTRMEDVNGLLGSPSQVGTFDQTVWYYISQTTERTAFLAPELVDQHIVMVRFDASGVVTDVKSMNGAELAQEIEMVDRRTPTNGRELTFMEQLLGNVGRFSTKNNNTGVTRGTGS